MLRAARSKPALIGRTQVSLDLIGRTGNLDHNNAPASLVSYRIYLKQRARIPLYISHIFKVLIDRYIVYHCIKQLTKTMDSTTAPPSDVVEIN